MEKKTESGEPMRVLISGGGTGGHIFPALSIAGKLREADPRTELLFVGAENRMEMERVPAAGYEIIGLPVAGFDRRRLWRNAAVLVKLWRSMRRARSIIHRFRPDIVVGVGGFASGPVLKEAQKMGLPTLIQEQNSYAGVTNKLLAAKADAICVAYEGMERFFPAERITVTGNPVRGDLDTYPGTPAEARAELGFDPAKPLVLVTGGSLGARTINDATALALDRLTKAGIQVLWQTGRLYEKDYTRLARPFEDRGVHAMAFISDMRCAYRAADLVVSRAGASTISELQNLGKPAVLIPSPNVAEDHQRKNAMALVDRDAAVMIPDSEAAFKLGKTVARLIADPDRLAALGRNAYAMRHEGSAEAIVEIIQRIIRERKK